jgi:hypothetical protein
LEFGDMSPLSEGATRRANQSADISAHSKRLNTPGRIKVSGEYTGFPRPGREKNKILSPRKEGTVPKNKRPAKIWVYSPRLAPGTKVPIDVKSEVNQRAQDLVEAWKPTYIKKPPKKAYPFNYIGNLYTKWRGGYFYFCATYACPGPRALSPSFEAYFTRLQYVGNNRFNLAYMRHTDKWWETLRGLTLADCLETIRGNSLYHP